MNLYCTMCRQQRARKEFYSLPERGTRICIYCWKRLAQFEESALPQLFAGSAP